MTVNRLKILVGGVQLRDGVVTVTDILGRIFTRAGLHVLAMERGYASTIYGAHQFDPLVVSEEPPVSWGDPRLDILVALDYDSNPDAREQPNRDTILRHGRYLVDGGVLLYDSSTGEVPVEPLERRGIKVFPVPARTIARDELKLDVVKNMVAVGALFRVLEFDQDGTWLRQLVEERFARKGAQVVDLNLRAARRGREVVESILAARGWPGSGYRLQPRPSAEPRVLISGNEALSLGAIAAGCRFYAGYPITPASAILEFMEEHLPRFGGRALQGQNERESIRAAIGAALAGVRSMVGTSGPGLSLKVEEFGVAGMTEVPVVIVDTQRAGPSTGMPTKSEQGDLYLSIFGGHGEIPRIVLAPATQEECYTLMIEAHNLADKYQCPVFFLTDLNLSEGRKTVPEAVFTQHPVTIDRSTLVREADLRRDGAYRRFALTPTGISPRLVPGTVGGVLKASGSEHDERGFVSTDPAVRKAMMEKRARKMETFLREDARPPRVVGSVDGRPALVGWGSTLPVLLEAQQRLRQRGVEVAVVHFSYLWPFPAALAKPVLERASVLIAVEQNFTGQFADVIQACCLLPVRRVVKYNGLPLYPADVVGGVEHILHTGESHVRIGTEAPAPVKVSEGG
ncbi:MAG: 2-oxoacid:acceptor oxidoreductase subunit alpha [Armatimonadota bacterium]|nr:2-oxoacid:acceptor oxidoreductase subunit alpha [Armatimonadota bacterium]MDR7437790.1 2-oxoacid:acceptor oxidoreductase subunit alpha [Armatimonadota bacterium]MDR7471286.1 2-oxoacid:acceptor oxidoreductase subunit alpha [Armatimonadota bacterium]MDR7506907.1 2-oxoacid:acceptor oxidoreductase subunit alpha [Armatimonadota bacterium]MDR7509334.1 2-oxoacid:acceptor oxidoreductase subunit alpha [Armatimonadota bacterium]